MIEKSLGLLFYLKKPKNYTGGEIPIYFRITIDTVPKELSTKRSIAPENWNEEAGRAAGTKETAKKLNEYLDFLRQKAYDARLYLLERGIIVTALAVRDRVAGKEERSRNLLVLFKAHNDEMEKMIGNGYTKGTWTTFNTSYTHTGNFIQAHYNQADINILSLNLSFVKSFYAWLRAEKKHAHNTAIKNVANMKKIVLACVDDGWLKTDPFVKFDMGREEVDIVFLISEELKSLARKKLYIQRLERIRDIFLFCCFTGLAYIDVKQLKRSELHQDNEGDWWIRKRRQKSKTASRIPLLPIAMRILAKYENDPHCLAKDMLLPVISNQKYNAYLKELADICQIPKELTTHVARFTFATTVAMENDVPMAVIKEVLGHSSYRQVQHYARVLAKKTGQAMKDLGRKLIKINFLNDYAKEEVNTESLEQHEIFLEPEEFEVSEFI